MNEPFPSPDDLPPAEPEPSATAPAGVVCDICRGSMYDFHCRLICPTCGFQRDCSDP